MEKESNYWSFREGSFWERRRLSRRELLRVGAAAGLGIAAGSAILGCSSGQPTPSGQAKPGQTPQAAQTSQAAQPKYGGVLRFGWNAANGYLSPEASVAGRDTLWVTIIGDTLIMPGADGNPDREGSLATSWKQEDDTTFLFNLRQGIKFHDGTDYDAAAQKYNLEWLLDPQRTKLYNSYRNQIASIKEMEVVDKYTLRLRLSRIDPGLLDAFGSTGGMPVSPTAIEKLGPDTVTHPVMTGPFVVKSFTPGGEWVFEKNPNYWRKGLPYLDGITIAEIPDDRVRAGSLQSGQLDAAYFTVGGEVTASLKKDPNLITNEVLAGPSIFSMNWTLPPLDNLKIRQAVAHCIDRETILKVVYQGQGQVAKGYLIQPGPWAYVDCSDVQYPFNIDKARQLIKETGLKTPIPFKLMSQSNMLDTVTAVQLVKGWLDDAGFDTSLESVSLAESDRRFRDVGDVHAKITTVAARSDPSATFNQYSTSNSSYNGGRKTQDPLQKQFDDLVKKGDSTYDQAARKKVYDELQRLHTQYVAPYIVMTYRYEVGARRLNVKGEEKEMVFPALAQVRPRFFWKE